MIDKQLRNQYKNWLRMLSYERANIRYYCTCLATACADQRNEIVEGLEELEREHAHAMKERAVIVPGSLIPLKFKIASCAYDGICAGSNFSFYNLSVTFPTPDRVTPSVVTELNFNTTALAAIVVLRETLEVKPDLALTYLFKWLTAQSQAQSALRFYTDSPTSAQLVYTANELAVRQNGVIYDLRGFPVSGQYGWTDITTQIGGGV